MNIDDILLSSDIEAKNLLLNDDFCSFVYRNFGMKDSYACFNLLQNKLILINGVYYALGGGWDIMPKKVLEYMLNEYKNFGFTQ